MRRALVGGAVALVAALLVVGFARALPDAAERSRAGRYHRIKAVCEEALHPEPTNPVLGPLPAAAPDLQLSDYQGRPVSLASLRGRVVLVNFWFTRCDPCIAEVPSLEQLARAERGKPFTLLAVSVDDDWKTVRDFFHEGSSMLVALDADKKVPPRFGTEKYPESFLVDTDGRILFYVVSNRDWSTPGARACIDAMLE